MDPTGAGAEPEPEKEGLLRHILDNVLPLLLLSSLSVTSFLSRWRTLHSNLSHLHSLLTSINVSSSSNNTSNHNHPLLLHLLPSLLSTLRLLLSLASRCSSPSALLSGKLHLQSDLHSASQLLSLHLNDLIIILSATAAHHQYPQTNCLVLSLPGPTSSRSDLVLFVKDAFARIQIGTLDLKQQSLGSLLQLISSDPPKISLLIAQENDSVSSLVRLLDPSNHSLIRDQAAAIVSILTTTSDASRKAVFEEGGLGPLLRLVESGSAAVKEHAATAIEAMTADPSNAWAVSAYGGIGVLVAACRSGGGGSPAVQALAAGSLRSVAAVDDLRAAMVEEGAVPVLIDLLASGTNLARKNAAICLWSLASQGDEDTRAMIFREGGLKNLEQLVLESSDPDILEHGLGAIHAISSSYAPAAKAIIGSYEFFAQLTDLIMVGSVAIQQLAACLIPSLNPSEEIKRSMAACMPSLIKMLELPKPAIAQEVATDALVCLLAVRSNRVELGRDAKSLTKLVQMLDPKREEICKKFPISVVLALAASGGCRKRLSELGACQQLQKLVDSDVGGAKKALKMIAGSKLKNLFSLSWRE